MNEKIILKQNTENPLKDISLIKKPHAQQNLEKNKEIQRDNYGLVAAFLPLVGVIIWLGLVLINAFVVESSRITQQSKVNQKIQLIDNVYGETLLKHGELVTKTNQLAGVIEKDIQPEEVFLLVEDLFGDDPSFEATGFGREKDGSFNVTIKANTFLRFTKIARRFNNYDKVDNVQIRSITSQPSNSVVGTINFNFIDKSQINNAGQSQ